MIVFLVNSADLGSFFLLPSEYLIFNIRKREIIKKNYWSLKIEEKKISTEDYPDIGPENSVTGIPCLLIFNKGEEVKRFQADISFAMKATKNDVQEVVDEIIMDQF